MLINVFFVALLPLISANVYPTQPVQATVWTANQPMAVSWVDDGRQPKLREIKTMGISLYRDTDTYLTTLASDVDPLAKNQSVVVSDAVLKTGSKYTLRFMTNTTVLAYSADFEIAVGKTTLTSMPMSTMTTTTMGYPASPSYNVPFSCTSASASSVVGTPSPDVRLPSAARQMVDVEKLKFRFVFVIWPVLMGISMAL